MNIIAPPLAPDERQEAFVLWPGLTSSTSMPEVEAARENLHKAPRAIQTVITQLAPDECAMARLLWDELMFAPSRHDLDVAQQALREAPFCVQKMVMDDMTDRWLQNDQPVPDDNPFR